MEREFKDSGIEWIGRIPSEWKMHPLAIYFAENNRPNSDLGSVKALQFKYGEIVQKPNNGKELTDKDRVLLEKYTVVLPDDIVVNGLNLNYDLKSLRVAKVREEGIITSAYIVLRPRNYANASYYNYYLKALDFQKIFHGMGVGIRLTLSYNELRSMLIPVPSKDEQQHIADYLDKKCGEIDELIALQEHMIAQLTDYKQSVITEAVTKGLNPDAELVLSGIDWIGDVPKHWNIIKIGFIFDNLDYLREPISAELRERNNPQYDYYGASGVIDKIDHYNVDDKVLLIGEDGANLIMRNLPLVYKAEGKFWVNNHAHILKPKKDNYDYMAHSLEAANYRNYITGSAQPKLSQENLQAVKIPVPPLSEQQSIATYLDTKCSEIDSLIAIKQQKIETLKDYKKSVIYEAVTGKMSIGETP